jgi:hypothetical protein
VRCGRARVCVDLHRDRLLGMPKDSHDHARMHIEVDEQCGEIGPRIHTLRVKPTSAVLHRFIGASRCSSAQGGSAMTRKTTLRHRTEAAPVARRSPVGGMADLGYPVT